MRTVHTCSTSQKCFLLRHRHRLVLNLLRGIRYLSKSNTAVETLPTRRRATDSVSKQVNYRVCVGVGVILSQGKGADDRVGVTVCEQANHLGESEKPLCPVATNKSNQNTVLLIK
jgi:hypothetical protein